MKTWRMIILYVFQQPIEIESIIDEVYLEGYEEGRGEERKSYGILILLKRFN